MKKRILQPHEIKQPIGGLIYEERKETDWIGGASGAIPDINPEGDWDLDITEHELQRNFNFDSFSCVTQSILNQTQALINHKYGEKIDWSKRYVAVGSGTIPGQGNSVNNVAEFLRKKGTVLESDYPTMTPEMTQKEFYKPIPQEVRDKECFLKDWAYNHYYLDTTLQNGLKKSPIIVSVEGYYHFDNRGRVVWGGGQIAHEVMIKKIEGDTAIIEDSENPEGYVLFDVNYKFQGAKIANVNKLNTNMQLTNNLMRNADNGKIYLIDSDDCPHWIKTENAFKKWFGVKAWDTHDWITSDSAAMADLLLKEKDPITEGSGDLVRAILNAIQKFGAKIGIK